MYFPRKLCWVIATLLLGGCSAAALRQSAPATATAAAVATPLPSVTPSGLPLPISTRLVMPASDTDRSPPQATEQLYSFFARDFPIDQVLALFARAYKLNIVVDRDVTGSINVEFHDLPFDQAMEAMLGSLGFHWERDGGLARVRAMATRTFAVDYIRVVRMGEAQTSSTSNSSAAASSGGGLSSSGVRAAGGIACVVESHCAISIEPATTARFVFMEKILAHACMHAGLALVVGAGACLAWCLRAPQLELAKRQLESGWCLPQALVPIDTHQIATLLWADSLFAIAFGVVLAYVLAPLLQRLGNPRSQGMFCVYGLVTYLLADLTENGLTGFTLQAAQASTVFGIPGKQVAAFMGCLITAASVAKFAALAAIAAAVIIAVAKVCVRRRFKFIEA